MPTITPRYLFWSGSADSTALMVKGLEEGLRIDEIFLSETGMEFPEMYEYITRVEAFIKKKYNRTVTHLYPQEGKGYKEFSRGLGVIRKKEQVRGIPRQLEPCWLQRNAKIRPFEAWLKEHNNPEHLIYIGYTADELKRARLKVKTDNEKKLEKLAKLEDDKQTEELVKLAHLVIKNETAILASNHLYPLIFWDMSAEDTKTFLQERGILNPLYKHFDRTGCFMCPKAGLKTYYLLWKYYPQEWRWLKKEEKSMRKLNAFNTSFNKDYTIKEMERKFETTPMDNILRKTTENDFCFCVV